jgi:hypothetical protein
MSRTSVVAALTLVVVACGSGEQRNQGANDAANSSANVSAATGNDATAPAAPIADRRAVVLEATGLRVVNSEGGAARPLAFGMPADQTLQALTAAFGRPPVERGTNAECGAGPLEIVQWEGGFTALFQEDRFAGWGAGAGLATVDGIGIGSTRRDLERSQDPQIEPSSLGTEFSAGGLGGILASDDPGAEITELWAGVTCHFR